MLRQQIYRSKCLPIYQDVRFLIIYTRVRDKFCSKERELV